jgi:hypothetical protein
MNNKVFVSHDDPVAKKEYLPTEKGFMNFTFQHQTKCWGGSLVFLRNRWVCVLECFERPDLVFFFLILYFHLLKTQSQFQKFVKNNFT